ncbi:MAG: hypothetical protein QXU97_04690 [Fervidicoccaceae archaeon]
MCQRLVIKSTSYALAAAAIGFVRFVALSALLSVRRPPRKERLTSNND